MSKPVTHNCRQGTPEWLALRAKYFTASEAPAMLGVSKYQPRSALLKVKATGIVPEVDAGTQRLFDAGHEAEEKARPEAEMVIGEDLFPVTMSLEVDGLPLLASLDGITADGSTIWENKLWNAEFAIQVESGTIPDTHWPQLEQQLLVSGAEKCYFTVSDGTPSNTIGAWYYSQPDRRAALIAGWKQFAEDLATYQHVEQKPAVVADAIEDLPALTVQLTGQVTASNLDAFESAVKARIQAISTDLVTDADFANADKMVKFLGDGEKRLELVKAQALAQTASIDQLFRTIDVLREEMRAKRLALDKLVKTEKENRKAEIVTEARAELMHHVTSLNKRIGISTIEAGGAIFAEAIKGLKSLDSMRDKVSVALANAKIEANAIADRIDINRKAMGEHANLFPDFASVCTKAADDFAALVAMRVAQQKEADEKRLAAERERIRAEEEAKARREADQKAQMAEHERLVAERAAAREAAANQPLQEHPAACVQQMPKSETQPASTETSETQPGATLKLGEINAMLSPVSVNADGLASLGIHPVATEKNAKLYEASKFPTICRLISEHVMAQAFKKAA